MTNARANGAACFNRMARPTGKTIALGRRVGRLVGGRLGVGLCPAPRDARDVQLPRANAVRANEILDAHIRRTSFWQECGNLPSLNSCITNYPHPRPCRIATTCRTPIVQVLEYSDEATHTMLDDAGGPVNVFLIWTTDASTFDELATQVCEVFFNEWRCVRGIAVYRNANR